MDTDIAIIGGGLSGLALAHQLSGAGRNFQIFEARDRLGGRILSLPYDIRHDSDRKFSTDTDQTCKPASYGFDLGPSWFWPGQTRMEKLIRDLGLNRFDQHASGSVCLETATGQVLRNHGFASMQGSWRLETGMAGLIDGLAAALPPNRIHLEQEVVALNQDGTLRFKTGQICRAKRIILALPPRLTAQLSFSPALSNTQVQALEGIPTWMGGHAKFMALYDCAFWRDAGLSGDAMSQAGPLAEIHDASAPDHAMKQGASAALFGFVGLPAQDRHGNEDALIKASLQQLTRIFGQQAAQPISTHLQDWAQEHHSSSPRDRLPQGRPPAYGLPLPLQKIWGGLISLCVSEVAPEMGGYLEGALAVAEQQAALILREGKV